MIPKTTTYTLDDFTIAEQPSHTYRMDLDRGNRIAGYADGLEAMRQAIFKILNTERYEYVMYSWNYGIETMDLYGKRVTWVCPKLERRVKEALLQDTRILKVDNFCHNTRKKGYVVTSFTVHTIFGTVEASKEVVI